MYFTCETAHIMIADIFVLINQVNFVFEGSDLANIFFVHCDEVHLLACIRSHYGIKSSATTVNRTVYLFSLAGFTILTLHSPSRVFNDLPHICSILVDGVNSAAGTWRAEMRFTHAPQSSWSFTSSRPVRILAESNRFVGVSSR